jgi:flagellar hook-associated protein 2
MTISSSSYTPTLSSPGIGSGLDVKGLVAKLMAVEQQPLTDLQTKQTAYQSTISAFGTVKGALSTFQTALKSLMDPSTFRALSATPGDASILSSNATAGAVPGSYSVEVTRLAQAQKVASTGFANLSDVVGTGTLTFDFGTFDGTSFTSNGSASKSVAIGAGQQTLAGVRDAVNTAGIGVTASIVNDGSASGNRLVFTSASSGAANSLKISVADDDGNNVDAAGLSRLAFDPAAALGSGRNMTQNVAAQNALLTIDGIAVSKSTNSVTDAIQGVTLNLAKTNIGTPTTLTVAQDSKATTQAVQTFVTTYNNLHATLDNLTKYDPTTQAGSVLTGDSTVRLIQSQLRGVIGNPISGLSDNLNALSQAGVSYQTDGTLTLNSTKLAAAINANFSGIGKLFAAIGQASDSLVGVSATGDKTQSGTYAVTVTQLPTQGNLAGTAAAGLTITAGVNDQLAVTVDGVATTVTLAAGTYASSDALAAEVQAKVNGAAALSVAGSSVSVRQSGGVLSVQSNRYGSASNVSVSGSAASLFGASSVATSGVDVAGTIDGVAALGAGQTLSGAAGTRTEGLQLQITGGGTGARGTVTYTQGYASQLNRVLKPILDSNGILAARTDGLTGSIKHIDDQKVQLQARLDVIQARYTREFSALDAMLGSMQQTSSFLAQQLANLPTPGKKST